MRLNRFDLNLLVAFDALVTERSVTDAARRLNLTQSAMSAALQRLRDALGDPLLVRHGRGMIPTTVALSLAPEVKELLVRLRQLIDPAPPFDPASSVRVFRIAASDYIASVLLAPLIRQILPIAPDVRIDIELPGEATAGRLNNADIDLVLTPEEFVERDHPAELLFEERHIVVSCANNPRLTEVMTAELFSASSHVAVAIEGRNTYVENEMRRLGIDRRIDIRAPSFMQAAWLLPGTDRIALMHERLAQMMVPLLGLVIRPLPFALPSMREMMQYHTARRDDHGLQWLMSEIRTCVARSN